MQPELSVVIPTLNEERLIAAVLDRAVYGSGLEHIEVIVADGGSTDRTVQIAGHYARVFRCPRGRAGQMNCGSQQTRGQVLLYCHADTALPTDYGVSVMRALAFPDVVGGSFTPIYSPSTLLLRLVERVIALPTPRLMFGDQAIFCRRSAMETVGFYPPIEMMEDVALVQKLQALGKLVRLDERVVTSSRRLLERGVLRQLWLDLRLLTAYYLGARPNSLALRYRNTVRDFPA